MIKFKVLSRRSSDVKFTAELDCDESLSASLKLGLAVKWAYRHADPRDAVMSGANLSGALLHGAVMSGANLSDSDLSGADLRGADLSDANLSSALLHGANLSGALLRGALLRDSDLSGADLRGVDLSDAVLRAGLKGVPKIDDIHQKVYTAASQPDALDMTVWHNSCGTTHCRAGWIITLAGRAGRDMEFCMGTPAAAAMIYIASDPKIERIPNFYASYKDALADMKKLAEQEASHAYGREVE